MKAVESIDNPKNNIKSLTIAKRNYIEDLNHSKEQFKCEECGKFFSEYHPLQQHKIIESIKRMRVDDPILWESIRKKSNTNLEAFAKYQNETREKFAVKVPELATLQKKN